MLSLIGDIVLWGGVFFMAVAAIGLIRLPDFYTRAHAVSKSETLGIGLILLGLALHENFSLISIKLALALLFAFLANPLAANLLTRAALRSGVRMWSRRSTGPEVENMDREGD
jgi:multicomponent Na+:H+ antiporter subunit G